jgi:SAM-dependent methyltransferase
MHAAHDRIRSEANFQDRRTTSQGNEPRDKFYFLADRAIQRYEEALGAVAGKKVLVVGCATGGVTPLARRGAIATGIDVSAEAIARLSAAIRREGLEASARALVMNAEDVAFEPGSFDLICGTGVLHHLDIARACRSWTLALRTGGRVVLNEPMAWNPGAMLYRWLTPSSHTVDEHPLTPGDLRTLRTFFADVQMESYVLFSVGAAPLAYFPRLKSIRDLTRRVLESVDTGALRICPALRFCAWTSVISCNTPLNRSW